MSDYIIKSKLESYINPLYPIVKKNLEDCILNSYVNENIPLNFRKKIIYSDPSILTCLAYPCNELNKLVGAGIYFYWTLIFDYIINRHEEPKTLGEELLNVIDNKPFNKENSLCLILKEIFNRMEFNYITDINFRNATRSVIKIIVDSNTFPEKFNNLNKNEYLKFRHYDFYSPCMFVLSEVPFNAFVITDLYEKDDFKKLINLFSQYIFYTNDIVSYNYENVEKKNINITNINIINIYLKEKLSVEDSLQQSLNHFYEIENKFIKQCNNILITYPEYFYQLYKFIENLKLCCAGIFM